LIFCVITICITVFTTVAIYIHRSKNNRNKNNNHSNNNKENINTNNNLKEMNHSLEKNSIIVKLPQETP
jgi:cell division protein YceG involved in septum cleavage